MSTLVHFDSEVISQTVGAQSSRVPTPIPDDPYVAVRQAYLVDTNTKSEPEEAPSEIEECQPLVSRAPLADEELEVSEHQILGSPYHIPQLHRIPPHHYHIQDDVMDDMFWLKHDHYTIRVFHARFLNSGRFVSIQEYGVHVYVARCSYLKEENDGDKETGSDDVKLFGFRC
ncbi:hypothetical protein Tco_0708491 [Tanacetum coccineum]